MNPLEIASSYAATLGVDFNEEMKEMFNEVLTLAEREEN
jgi:hypothetical protein